MFGTQYQRTGLLSTVVFALAFILSSPAWTQPSEALVYDGRGRDLYRVDLFTGDRTLVSGTRWNMPSFLLSEASGTALMLDNGLCALDRVHFQLASAERLAQSTPSNDFSTAASMIMRDATHVLLAINASGAIVEVDLVTGSTAVLSGPSDLGPPRRRITAMVLEDADHVLVTQVDFRREHADPWRDGLFRVDLTTGDWTPVVPAEPLEDGEVIETFLDPRAIFINPGGGYTLLETVTPGLTHLTASGEPVISVALITDGEGTPLVFPAEAIEQDSANLWVLDLDLSAIYSVNRITGQRTLVSAQDGRGTGPGLARPVDMALSPDGTRLWVLTGLSTQQIVEVDPTTGDRVAIFDSTVGSGPMPESGALDLVARGSGRAIALANGGRALFGFDLTTGNRTEIMELAPPVQRIASGPGQMLWGLRSNQLVRISMDIASMEEVASEALETWDGMMDVSPIGPDHLVITRSEIHNSTVLLDLDLRGATPVATELYDDYDASSVVLEHVAAADEDRFIFVVRYPHDDWSLPGIYRFTRSDIDMVSVSLVSEDLGAPMPSPRQVAIDETDTVWVVNGLDPPTLLRVDLVSGLRTEISGPGRGSGPLWQTATSMVLLDSLPDTMGLGDVLGHLLGLDPLTGNAYDAIDVDNSGEIDAADLVLLLGL